MGKLKPLQVGACKALDLRRFLLTQTFGAAVDPDTSARQALPGLYAARTNNLLRSDLPINGQGISFRDPEGARFGRALSIHLLAREPLRIRRAQRPHLI